jgi:hypothetical protein
LQFWHVRRIIRGYRNRDKLKHQLLAEVVYASIHVMRDAKGKTVQDMFPMLWEKNDEDDDEGPDLSQYTDEYIAECQDMMKDYKFG